MKLVQQLLNIAKEKNINCFESSEDFIEFDDDLIRLEKNTLDELLRFTNANNINSLFYTNLRYDKDEYIIDENLLEKLDFRLIEHIKPEIDVHNKEIQKIDFTNPVLTLVYCIYESHFISINEENDWLEHQNILTAHEKLSEILENKEDVINQ